MISLPRLILASGSPRRSEILTAVGWPFEKDVPDIDESEIDGEAPEDYVLRLATTKAESVAQRYPRQTVLGADTTVVINNRIIGKPADLEEARKMIELLSGNWHDVLTGVAVVSGERTFAGFERTRVKFAPMSDSEIQFLVHHGDPLDKAGAYAVQAQAALFIEGIEGDYWNVVGLPVRLVYQLVNQAFSESQPGPVVFGRRQPGIEYQERRAAYVVVIDEAGRVAAIAGDVGHNLPGGGLSDNESVEDAIKREIDEELGIGLEPHEKIGEAIQFSSVGDNHIRMESTFIRGEFKNGTGATPQYEIHWISLDEVDGTIFQESHRWAIKKAVASVSKQKSRHNDAGLS